MKTESIIKLFEGHSIRIAGTPEAPLFCAADVCAVLGLQYVAQAVETLDADETAKYKVPTLGGEQEMHCVTESGLYHLIFKSRKATAKRFRRWVTETVLPEIRMTGAYTPAPAAPLPNLDDVKLPLTAWIATLGLDLRNDAQTVVGLLSYIGRAALTLRWGIQLPRNQRNAVEPSTFQEIPLSVLNLAEGMWLADTNARRAAAALPAPARAYMEILPPVTPVPSVRTGGTIQEIARRQREAAAAAAQEGRGA